MAEIKLTRSEMCRALIKIYCDHLKCKTFLISHTHTHTAWLKAPDEEQVIAMKFGFVWTSLQKAPPSQKCHSPV